MKTRVGALLALLGAGCSNGWGSTGVTDEASKICDDFYVGSTSKAGHELLTPIQDVRTHCIPIVAAAIEPCREHKRGSDSALQCVERRGGPAVMDAAKWLLETEVGSIESLRTRIKGMGEADRGRWCAEGQRNATEKLLCQASAAEIEAAKKPKGTDPFGLDF